MHPFYADSASVLTKERNLWQQIAGYFRDYDDRLAFCGTGEPHAGDFFSKPTEENLFMQKRFNQVFVDAVRSTGGYNSQRNLIVQTYQTDPRRGFKKEIDAFEGSRSLAESKKSLVFKKYGIFSYLCTIFAYTKTNLQAT